jgi:hypothetical protein
MNAYFQVLIALAVVLQLLSQDVPLPEDVVPEIVVQTIDECDVPQLTGKRTRRPINPYVKLLCALKMICFGVSGSAFVDCHQFGETTARRCVHHRSCMTMMGQKS